jgi:hypothetical protein
LGLTKDFVTVTKKHGEGFEHLRKKLSDAKLKEGVFIRPHIREIISDYLYEHLLTETDICMANVQSGLSKFPWTRKSRKLQGTC